MKEVRFFYVPDAQNQTELPADEAVHAVRVLRMKTGDELYLMDGIGSFCKAEVAVTTGKRCSYIIKEVMPQAKTWTGRIHLAIAPTKDIGRMEWMVEKATEIGFDEITFLDCKFSERKQMRKDRIEKIAISAMKQSRKGWLPVINEMTPFGKFITQAQADEKYICHCYKEVEKKDFFSSIIKPAAYNSNILILVGPEGDFSIDEVQAAIKSGYMSVTLGESRLRTETAGLEAVAMLQLAHRKTNNVFNETE